MTFLFFLWLFLQLPCAWTSLPCSPKLMGTPDESMMCVQCSSNAGIAMGAPCGLKGSCLNASGGVCVCEFGYAGSACTTKNSSSPLVFLISNAIPLWEWMYVGNMRRYPLGLSSNASQTFLLRLDVGTVTSPLNSSQPMTMIELRQDRSGCKRITLEDTIHLGVVDRFSATTVGQHNVFVCNGGSSPLAWGVSVPLAGIGSAPMGLRATDEIVKVQGFGDDLLLTLSNGTILHHNYSGFIGVLKDYESHSVVSYILPNRSGHIFAFKGIFTAFFSAGLNAYGQRALATSEVKLTSENGGQQTSHLVPFGKQGIDITTTASFTVILLLDGSLAFSGDAIAGQLCHLGEWSNIFTETFFPFRQLRKVVAQPNRTFFLTGNTLIACGLNKGKMITSEKNETFVINRLPMEVFALKGLPVSTFDLGEDIGCAILTNGSLRCWTSQLLTVSCALNDVESVTVGTRHATVLLKNRSVVTCGRSCGPSSQATIIQRPGLVEYALDENVRTLLFETTSVASHREASIVLTKKSPLIANVSGSRLISLYQQYGLGQPPSGVHSFYRNELWSVYQMNFFIIPGYALYAVAVQISFFNVAKRAEAFSRMRVVPSASPDGGYTDDWTAIPNDEVKFLIFAILYKNGIRRFLGGSAAELMNTNFTMEKPQANLSFLHSRKPLVWSGESLLCEGSTVWGSKNISFPSNVTSITLFVSDGVCLPINQHDCTEVSFFYGFEAGTFTDTIQRLKTGRMHFQIVTTALTGFRGLRVYTDTLTPGAGEVLLPAPEPVYFGFFSLAVLSSPDSDTLLVHFPGEKWGLTITRNRVVVHGTPSGTCTLNRSVSHANSWQVVTLEHRIDSPTSFILKIHGQKDAAVCTAPDNLLYIDGRYTRGIVLEFPSTIIGENNWWIDDVMLCTSASRHCIGFSNPTSTMSYAQSYSNTHSASFASTITFSHTKEPTVSESFHKNKTKSATGEPSSQKSSTPTKSLSKTQSVDWSLSRTESYTRSFVLTTTKTSTLENLNTASTLTSKKTLSQTLTTITLTDSISEVLHAQVMVTQPLNLSVYAIQNDFFWITLTSMTGLKWNHTLIVGPDDFNYNIMLQSNVPASHNKRGFNALLKQYLKQGPVPTLWNPHQPLIISLRIGPWSEMHSRQNEIITVRFNRSAFIPAMDCADLSFIIRGAEGTFLNNVGVIARALAFVLSMLGQLLKTLSTSSAVRVPTISLLSHFQCYSEEANELDVTLNPGNLKMGDSTEMYLLGAAIWNFCFIMVVVIMQLLIVCGYKKLAHCSWNEAQANTRFPSITCIFWMLLFPGTSYAMFSCIKNNYWIGLLLLVYFAPFIYCIAYNILDNSGFKAKVVTIHDREYGTHSATDPSAVPHWRKYFDARGLWVSIDSERTFVDRFGALFADLTEARHSYLATELFFSCIIALTSAIETTSYYGCMAQGITFIIFTVLQLGIFVWYQPYNTNFLNHSGVVIISLQLLSIATLMITELTQYKYPDIQEAASLFFTITFITIDIVYLLQFALRIHDVGINIKAKKQRKAQELFQQSIEESFITPFDSQADGKGEGTIFTPGCLPQDSLNQGTSVPTLSRDPPNECLFPDLKEKEVTRFVDLTFPKYSPSILLDEEMTTFSFKNEAKKGELHLNSSKQTESLFDNSATSTNREGEQPGGNRLKAPTFSPTKLPPSDGLTAESLKEPHPPPIPPMQEKARWLANLFDEGSNRPQLLESKDTFESKKPNPWVDI